MSDKLLPCPFCNHPSPREEWFLDGTRFFNYIECFDCGASGAFSLDKEKAKNDWNFRATPPGYVTEEECKRRCLLAVAMVLRSEGCTPSEYDKEHVEKWYAEHWGER